MNIAKKGDTRIASAKSRAVVSLVPPPARTIPVSAGRVYLADLVQIGTLLTAVRSEAETPRALATAIYDLPMARDLRAWAKSEAVWTAPPRPGRGLGAAHRAAARAAMRRLMRDQRRVTSALIDLWDAANHLAEEPTPQHHDLCHLQYLRLRDLVYRYMWLDMPVLSGAGRERLH